MAKGYNATEYMFSSARIRAFETKIAGREQIWRMADAPSSEAVVAMLAEYGFEAMYEGDKLLREETLMSALKRAFDELSSMECADAVRFLRYQYDCNNIKAVMKCAVRGISPDGMLLPLGTVDLDEVKAAYIKKDYSVFPKNMAEAIVSAEEAFTATSNPQKIDFIIDKAVFADMLDSAKGSGVALAERLVRMKIDGVNIMTAVRVLRMKLGAQTAALFDEVYIEGGSIEKDRLVEAMCGGEEALATALAYGEYSAVSELISNNATLGNLEKVIEDRWMSLAREARFAPFGAEVAIGYVCALEYEVKNIRIVLAGKDAGLSPETIRERLRESYV